MLKDVFMNAKFTRPSKINRNERSHDPGDLPYSVIKRLRAVIDELPLTEVFLAPSPPMEGGDDGKQLKAIC